MIVLAETLDLAGKAAQVAGDRPDWLVFALALMAFLSTSGIGAAIAERIKRRRAESERDAVIEGVEKANGSAARAKLEVKRTAHERGVGASLHEAVKRVTTRLER